MYPREFKYTKDHEWVKIDGDLATVGISDYAQKELGEIVYVELPSLGSSFSAGQVIGSVESVKAVSDVFSPISGEVETVNELLEEEPELINNDPHGQGWILTLKVSNKSEIEKLMDAVSYERYLSEEAGKK